MNARYLSLKKYNKKVDFAFFTSNGGVSKGNYYSLNCNFDSEDKALNVEKNLKIALKSLGVHNKLLKLINQTHSKKIHFIDKKNIKNNFYGDGLITKDKNIVLGVLTADCAPVFLFDSNYSVVCCVHSGWRGAFLNIIKESIIKFKKENIKRSNIVAIIGPCLGHKNFEVNKDFKLKFKDKNLNYQRFFQTKNKTKDLFNLRGLINFQLKSEGITNIHNIRRDTYKNGHIFFSHRRATHEKKNNTGRMLNIITLKD